MSLYAFRRDVDGETLASFGAVSTVTLTSPSLPAEAIAAYASVSDGFTIGSAPVNVRVDFAPLGQVTTFTTSGTLFDVRKWIDPVSLPTASVTITILDEGVTFDRIDGGEMEIAFGYAIPGVVDGGLT